MPTGKAPRTDEDRAFDTEVGERIRAIRQAAGLTQSQVATAAGVTFQQMQKYERGDNRVAASRLVLIAKAVGVPASQLLGEGQQPSEADNTLRSQVSRLNALFQKCSPAGRQSLLDLASALAQRAPMA